MITDDTSPTTGTIISVRFVGTAGSWRSTVSCAHIAYPVASAPW